MDDIMKIIKSLEKPALLIKGVNETIENEEKEQRSRFLSMSLRCWFIKKTINMWRSKIHGRKRTRASEGAIRAGEVRLE